MNNSLVNNLIETFWELYRRLDGSLPITDSPVRHAPLHLAIVEALRKEDADLAMHRMREHFDDVRLRTRALES